MRDLAPNPTLPPRPSFKEECLRLPEEVTKELENYTDSFKELKGNRTLQWKPHLGQVR